ncbi:MAG: DUF2726 domain-containing protein [Burkholderiales bacterium]
MPTSVWILAAVAVVALVGLTVLMLWWTSSRRTPAELPQEWPLMQRSIFSTEERALYRQLRAALPHHTVLAKLPLVRFCQPIERNDLRYWFTLLGPIHVSFVVCAENGRALAALDIDKPNRRVSERAQKIKQSVLDACRIRYVRCSTEQLPTAAELQLLVPHQGEAGRPWMPSSMVDTGQDMRSTLAHAVRARRNDNETQWVDSGYAADSFFSADAGNEPDTGPGPLTPPQGAAREPSGRWAGSPPPEGGRRSSQNYGNDEDGTHIIGRR